MKKCFPLTSKNYLYVQKFRHNFSLCLSWPRPSWETKTISPRESVICSIQIITLENKKDKKNTQRTIRLHKTNFVSLRNLIPSSIRDYRLIILKINGLTIKEVVVPQTLTVSLNSKWQKWISHKDTVDRFFL